MRANGEWVVRLRKLTKSETVKTRWMNAILGGQLAKPGGGDISSAGPPKGQPPGALRFLSKSETKRKVS